MKAVAYVRVSSDSQDLTRQRENLAEIAVRNGWDLKRTFAEKVSGTTRSDERKEFRNLLLYVREKGIQLVMVSEISRLSRRVIDCLTCIEELHSMGVGIYVQQFNMCSLEDGKENPVVKMLIQMLSMGAEMENSLRKERQTQGIKVAKAKGVYRGRKIGATTTKESLLRKHQDVIDLINNGNFSIRRISKITNRSVNTVRKLKMLVGA